MAKGTIYGTTNNQYIESKIEWSSIASTSSNSSVVTASLYYRRTNQGFTTSGTGSFIVSIDNGTKVPFSKYIIITYNEWTLVGTKTKTITHSGDGTKSITIAAAGSIPDTKLDSTSCIGTAVLDTIPRASTITSANSVTLGSRCKIKWTPMAASFYYKVKFSLGSWSYTTPSFKPGITTEYTYTDYPVPIDVAAYFPNSKTATMTATLYTYSNSDATTQIGSASSKTFEVILDENESTKPNITMSLSPITPDTKFEALYLQSRSNVQASFSGEGKYGATIKSYNMQVNGKTYASPYTSDILSKSGKLNVVGTVVDSRGFTNIQTIEIDVIPYYAPYLAPYEGYQRVVCERCLENGTASLKGTFLHVKGTRNYAKINSNGIVNTCSVRCRYKPEGGEWSHESGSGIAVLLNTDTTTDAFDKILDGVVLDLKKSYTVELSIGDDTYLPIVKTYDIPSESVTFHLKQGGKGAAFGKYAQEDNLLECEWDAQFNGKTALEGLFLTEKEIEIGGDKDTYYPVHIKPTYYSTSQPIFLGVGKELGSKSANWEGNHASGTSSLMIGWLCRFNGWDGNGSYMTTLYKSEIYSKLIAHVEGFDYSARGIVVYLRGGGASYKIACSVPIEEKVYLIETNIADSPNDNIDNVSPRTYEGNKGILNKSDGLSDVKEEGTSGDWYYRKWNNGKLECWGKKAVSVNISTPWESIYYGSVDAVDFPFSFSEPPICQVTAEFGSTMQAAWMCVAGKATKEKTPILWVCRPNISSATGFNILYYAIGNWK